MANTKNQLPKTLYYYCSLDTFFNIINQKTIRLSEISKSNDAFEQRFLAREIFARLDDFIKIIGDKNIDAGTIWELRNLYYEKVMLLQPFPVWAMCFSEKGDDLSQWRGYGDDGRGICIGFKYDYLNVVNDLTNTSCFDFMKLKKIEYGQEAVDNYFNELKNNLPDHKLNISEIKDCLDKILYGLCTVPYYKSDIFKDEKEWRIIYSYDSLIEGYTFEFDELNSIQKFGSNFEIIKKDYEIHNGYIKSYLELRIKDILNCIDIIFIGPKSKVTIKDIKRFLMDKIGYDNDIKIEDSKANCYR